VRFRILAREFFHPPHERKPAFVAEPNIDHAYAFARAVEPVIEKVIGVGSEMPNDRAVSQPPEGSAEA
jgi:hypothetical protein